MKTCVKRPPSPAAPSLVLVHGGFQGCESPWRMRSGETRRRELSQQGFPRRFTRQKVGSLPPPEDPPLGHKVEKSRVLVIFAIYKVERGEEDSGSIVTGCKRNCRELEWTFQLGLRKHVAPGMHPSGAAPHVLSRSGECPPGSGHSPATCQARATFRNQSLARTWNSHRADDERKLFLPLSDF